MRKLNNIDFANAIAAEIKYDLEQNPTHNKFDFKIFTRDLLEPFDKDVFAKIICTEIKCTIEIIQTNIEVCHIKGEVSRIHFQNGSQLIFENAISENSGRGATPLSDWDYLNKNIYN